MSFNELPSEEYLKQGRLCIASSALWDSELWLPQAFQPAMFARGRFGFSSRVATEGSVRRSGDA